MTDFYAGTTETTKELLDKAQQYVQLALANGDAVHMESGSKLVIQLLKKKDNKETT